MDIEEKRSKHAAYMREWSRKNKDKKAAANKLYYSKNRNHIIESRKVWKKANPEKVKASILREDKEKAKARRERWIAAHPDKNIEVKRAWRQRNIEQDRQSSLRWQKQNPEKVNACTAKRRATRKNATPGWANEFFISEIYRLAKLRTEFTGIKWHVDHIVPLQSPIVCGLHVECNLQVIPAFENFSKNNRHWPDMP